MHLEKALEQNRDYESLILEAFGGRQNLYDRIVEVIRSGKKIDYSPDFARAVAESISLPDNTPIIELMKVIQKVYPPLEEDYKKDKVIQEKTITEDMPVKKPWQAESARRYHETQAKKRGLSPEEYEEYNNV